MHRVVTILRTLASGMSGGVGLQDLARITGLKRPTLHRILKALVAEGVVEQKAVTRRYLIGEQIPMLALARPAKSPLLAAAQPIIERAIREVGDTLFLTIRTGDDTLCILRQIGPYPIQVLVIDVGARRPLGVSSAGLTILSRLPRAGVEILLARNIERLASYKTSPSAVLSRSSSLERQ